MSQIALGLFNGSVVLIYGDILYERNPKQRVIGVFVTFERAKRAHILLKYDSFCIGHLTHPLPDSVGERSLKIPRYSLLLFTKVTQQQNRFSSSSL